MRRTLLFDSGCALCTGVAHTIEREAGGWLVARSLHDPDIRALLDRTRPGWVWEPVLLEEEGDAARLFTGTALRARMVAGLGPRRALRVARLVHRATRRHQVDASRRTFLKRAGAMMTGIALGARFGLPAMAASGSDTFDNATYDTADLAVSHPDVARLRASATVHTASQHFGAPDWNRVRRFTSKRTGRTGFAIVYRPASGLHTVLSLGDPAKGEDTRHFISQLAVVHKTKKEATFAYHTADARLLGSITADKGGKVIRSHANAPSVGAALPGNFSCLLNCFLANWGAAVRFCGYFLFGCIFAPGPENPACDAFVACMLIEETICLIVCCC